MEIQQPLKPGTKVRRATGQIHSEIGGEVVLLNIDTGKYYGMNPVLSRIWNLIGEDSVDISDLIAQLLEVYEVSRNECERDLLEALEKLNSENLLVAI